MSFNPAQPTQPTQPAPPWQPHAGHPQSGPGQGPGQSGPGPIGSFQGTRPARRRPPYAAVALGWEALLLLALVVMLVVVGLQTRVLSSGSVWVDMAVTGLLASGFALSLRTATPNLAVLGQASLAAAVYATLLDEGWEWLPAMAIGVAAATVLGLILGMIAGATMAPGWAVSLAGLAITQAVVMALLGNQITRVDAERPDEITGYIWLACFVLISVAGGLLCLVPSVRRVLGGYRIAADDASWRGPRLVSALIGFTGSSLLAGVSGILFTNFLGSTSSVFSQGELMMVVSIALLAGVSVFGGRGGIAGVALATALVVLLSHALSYWGLDYALSTLVPGAVAIIAGLLVSRLLESIAGPPEPATGSGTPAGQVPAAPGSPVAADSPVSTGAIPIQYQSGQYDQVQPATGEAVEPLPRRQSNGTETS